MNKLLDEISKGSPDTTKDLSNGINLSAENDNLKRENEKLKKQLANKEAEKIEENKAKEKECQRLKDEIEKLIEEAAQEDPITKENLNIINNLKGEISTLGDDMRK